MAINVNTPFRRTGPNPIDDSITLTKAEMLAVNDDMMPDVYFAVCKDDGNLYTYSKTATPSTETGKFKLVEGGGGGGTVPAKTYTMDWDEANKELELNDGTITQSLPLTGLQSELTAGTNITIDSNNVISATGSGSTGVELTQAEYDALTEEEKNNGTIYFITDGQGGGGSYVLPPATATTLGGIKVGNGLSVETDGTLSASGSAGLPTFTTTAIDGTDVYNGNVVKIGTINVRGTNPSTLEEEGIYRFYFETEDLPSAGSKTYNLSSLLQGYYIDKFISATGSTSNGEIFTFNQSDPTRVTDLNPTNKTLTVTFDGDIPGDILLEITFIGEES